VAENNGPRIRGEGIKMKTARGTMLRWSLTGGVLASICGCSLCSGQIMTQPPLKAPNPADHIAIAPVPAPKPHMDVAPPPPMTAVTPTPVKPQVVLPDLPYAPLQKGLIEPAEFAALRVNPMLKPDDLSRFGKYMDDRKATFERIVADNLDLVEQIEGGIFETIDLSDNKSFTRLLDVSKPLRAPSAPKALIEELLDRQLVDPTQAEFNRKITREYHLSLSPQPKPDATPAEKGALARRSLALFYKNGLEEPLFVHRQLLLEGSSKLDKLVPALGLDSETASKVSAAAAAIKPNTGDPARLTAMAEINKALSCGPAQGAAAEGDGDAGEIRACGLWFEGAGVRGSVAVPRV
jgi:hypothetical protein